MKGLCQTIKKSADPRHTPPGSPQTTIQYEKASTYADSSIGMLFCSFLFRGGDSEAIEQMFSNVLYSVVAIAHCEDRSNFAEKEINREIFSFRLNLWGDCSRVAAVFHAVRLTQRFALLTAQKVALWE